MKDFISKKMSIVSLWTLVKACVFGLLATETVYFSRTVAYRYEEHILAGSHEYLKLALAAIGVIAVLVYMFVRGFFSEAKKMVLSWRIDLLIAFCCGVAIDLYFGVFGIAIYTEALSFIPLRVLSILIGLPFLLFGLSLLRTLQLWVCDKFRVKDAFFISDTERKHKTEDLLGFSEQAERFAERILNLNSPDSIVFGIDAPWGVGKSTFVNFCKEYWENNHRDDAIVYVFSPLRYEDRTHLLEKFVDGLVRVIQKYAFVPEIKPLINQYSRFIQAKASYSKSLFGINFELQPGAYTVDDAFDDLEAALSTLDKKVIIVVDDLDRLSFSAVKDVLFAIKKSFTLPNVSYVLCYDTDNISALEKDRPDGDKITEFLEKFVNVKVGLYLDSTILQKYVFENLDKVLSGNSQADPLLVSKAMGGLREIYGSSEFHLYLSFIGDVRKIKRLINILLLLEIEKADFEESDLSSRDVIHLLLVYINYPNIFRKIYSTETEGGQGFFSAVVPYEEGYPEDPSKGDQTRYKNSNEYKTYVGKLSENQAFLVNKLFNVETRLEATVADNVAEEVRHSFACFNGGWGRGRNLEEYLKLIVKLSKPQNERQYKFYLNRKNQIIKGRLIEEVLSEEDFSYSKSEQNHEQLWRVIANSSGELDGSQGAKLITYLLCNIQNYSLLTSKENGLGLRDDLNFFIIRLLDSAGWTDGSGKHYDNNPESVSEIAEWIFGEGRHAEIGVITTLADESRGIMGFHDLLAFRLFCSADRGGNVYNVQRALSSHGDSQAPTDGPVEPIVVGEMREISQRVFLLFVNQYIDKRKNIFDLIDALSLADFTGKYHGYVQEKIVSGEIKNVEKMIIELKSRLKSFITYQLGNSVISSGIGCGYYDVSGKKDEHGIRRELNKYLFGECFDPTKASKGYEHFVDYLLINYSYVVDHGSVRVWRPRLAEFTKVLERERLISYWKEHSAAIKALNLPAQQKVIYTGNYEAAYTEYLSGLYAFMDSLVDEKPVDPPND